MPKILALGLFLVIGCNRASPPQPSTGFASDSAALVTAARAPGFKAEAVGFTSFPDVPFRIGTLLLRRDTIARVLVIAIDSSGMRPAYDASFIGTGCGDPAPDLPAVDRFVLGSRLLLRVLIRRHDSGCVGASTVDYRTVHLLDASRAFREVFAYPSDSLDYGNPEDAAPRPVMFFHTYDGVNDCGVSDICRWVFRETMKSDRRTPVPAVIWKWNADTTAFVPVRR